MRSIRNCPVAVLGGAGFLGSHMVNHLIEDRGCQVLVMDNLVAGRRKFIHPAARFVHHDITGSEEHLKCALKEHKTVYAMNYIAYPYIPVSFTRPLHVFNVNATGAIKVINAAQEAGCEGILQVSSAEIYGEGVGEGNIIGGHYKSSGRLDEDAPVLPHSTYGAAKAAVDYYCQCAWKERQTPVIALRQFNCVGERETHPYVVPEIISQLARQADGVEDVTTTFDQFKRYDRPRAAEVRLGNNSFRDFLYAGDAVRAAVELLEKGSFGEVYNLGSEAGVKIYDLAERIGKVMGFDYIEVVPDPARVRPWEIWHLQAACDKIYSVIDYRPQVSLDDALRRTVEDFRRAGNQWCWEG
jgi:nucleoside-diphosphate-sugar epimerase